MKKLAAFTVILCISFDAVAQNFTVNGSAQYLGDNVYELTPDLVLPEGQAGAIWYNNPIDLRSDFTITTDIFFGSKDNDGADGIAFVLQPISDAQLGGNGYQLGYSGISPSLAIEFDTWQNAELGDPSQDHLAFMRNGDVNHNSVGNGGAIPFDANIEDGQWHNVTFSWSASTHQFTLYLPTFALVTQPEDIVNTIFGGNPSVYWGFTGATYAAANLQQVKMVPVTVSGPTTICAGDPSPILTAPSAISYRWLQDGNEVSTEQTYKATKTGNYTVEVTYGVGADGINVTDISSVIPVIVRDPPTGSISPVDTTVCPGSSVTLIATGGLTYNWYRDDTLQSEYAENFYITKDSGVYRAYIFDGNCWNWTSNSAIVKVNPPINATVRAEPATCISDSGSITIKASGGTPPYTSSLAVGSFKDSISFKLAIGQHTVTVKDSLGCTFDVSFNITKDSAAPKLEVSNPPIHCVGTAVDLTNDSITKGSDPNLTFSYWTDADASKALPDSQAVKTEGTYYIKATNSSGCFEVKAVNVTFYSSITFNVDSSAASCNQFNGSITIKDVSGGSSNEYEYSKDNGRSYLDTKVFSSLDAGIYKIVVRNKGQANCLSVPRDVTVRRANSTLTATIDPIINATCTSPTGSATINPSGGVPPYAYVVDSVHGTGNVLAELKIGKHTVTVKDSLGCTFDTTFSITKEGVAPKLEVSDPPIHCAGTAVDLTNDSITDGSDPNLTFTYWIDADASEGLPDSQAVKTEGTYYIKATNSSGCFEVKAVNVTFYSSITFNVDSSAASCNQSNGSITIKDVSGGSSNEYEYSKDNGRSYLDTKVFSSLEAGIYKIAVRNKDIAGCLSVPRDVTVRQANSTLTATIDPIINATCTSPTGSATINPSGGVPPYAYVVDSVPGTGNVLAELKIGKHTVTVKDSLGCTFDTTFSITKEGVAPKLEVSDPPIHCAGTAVDLTNDSITDGSDPNLTFTYWIDADASKALPDSQAVKTEGTYYIKATNSSGCFDIKSVNVTFYSSITFNVDSSAASCNQSNGSITIKDVSGGSSNEYEYSKDNGRSYLDTKVFSSLEAGIYKIAVRNKDIAGCLSVPRDVTVRQANSTLTATIDPIINATCTSPTGSATINPSGGVPPYAYVVDSVPGTGNVLAELKIGKHTVTVKDSLGCTFNTTFNITKDAATLKLEVSNPPIHCTGTAVDLTNDSITNGSDADLTFTYWKDADATQALVDPKAVKVQGKYYIKGTNSLGCFEVKPVEVTFYPPIHFDYTTSPASCGQANGSIQIVNVTGGIVPYLYKLDNNTFDTVSRFTNLALGNHTVTIQDQVGCTVSVGLSTVQETMIGVSKAVVVPQGKSSPLDARNIGNEYLWSPRDGLDDPNSRTPTVTTNVDITYTIRITTSSGCITVDTLRVRVSKEDSVIVFVPTAFTPNNNWQNDYLRPGFINVTELLYFKVYNRWGQLVFETKTVGEGWDGTLKGKPQPTETYTWILAFKDTSGNTIKKSGRSVLIR